MGTIAGLGSPDRALSEGEVARVCAEALDGWDVDGRRVVVLVPDRTRTCPLDALFAQVHRCLGPGVAGLDVLVALGTHEPMPLEAIPSVSASAVPTSPRRVSRSTRTSAGACSGSTRTRAR